jgi:tetratricopeptide (TPR) repeat protein
VDPRETAALLQRFLGDRYVLVCDPSPNFRTSIKQFLQNLKVNNVRAVSNTTEARRVLLTTKVALFIVEWIGEAENGIQFCREIKKRPEYRMAPFLLISSENMRQDVILASEGGIDRYLLKPFSFEDFTGKLNSLVKEELDPNVMNVLMRRADATLMAEEYDAAEELYREGQKHDPNSARAVTGLASICRARNQNAKAVALLQSATAMNPNFITPYRMLLELYEEQHDFEGMVAAAKKLNEMSPDNPSYALKLATLYLQQRDLVSSERFFKRAISLSPALAGAYKGLGDVAMVQRDFDKAEKHYKKALDLDKTDISTLNSLGMAFVRMGRFQEGIQRYLVALRIDSQNEKVLFNLGHAWEKLGNQAEARQRYLDALKVNPKFSKAIRGLARLGAPKDRAAS